MTPKQQAHYDAMIADGQSPRLAEVLALRKFPGLNTDDIFMSGRRTGNQFDHNRAMGNYYHNIAEEAGVSTSGKYYCAPLASYPGDPTAWISGRDDVIAIAKAKSLRIDGMVNYTPPEHEPAPDVPIASDILEREVALEMASGCGGEIEDVKERVFNRLTGRDDPHPLLVDDNVPSPMEVLDGTA